MISQWRTHAWPTLRRRWPAILLVLWLGWATWTLREIRSDVDSVSGQVWDAVHNTEGLSSQLDDISAKLNRIERRLPY